MFKEVEGDLFELGLPAIGHGVNCRGLMGAGIAKVFRKKYPAMYLRYSFACDRGKMNLGDMMIWSTPEVTIYNLATQYELGAEATLEAVETTLRKAARSCKAAGIKALGLPRIGCGIGGLKWEDVKAVMQKIAKEFPAVDIVAVSLPGQS